jgi:alpha,alpha-trehalose phosphorylase
MNHKHHIRAVIFNLDSEARTIEDTRDFIGMLRQRGILTALCYTGDSIPAKLELLNLEGMFDEVVCEQEASRTSADPKPFQLAADRLGLPAFHCLVIGVSPAAVEAAKRAGMKCVGLGSAEGLANAPAVIASFDEVDVEALLDSGRPYRPQPHGWELQEGAFRSARSLYWESMFAVTNGVIGVRGNLEEQNADIATYPASFVNGLVAYIPYSYMWAFPGYPHRGHCMINACEWTGVCLEVDGERFSMDSKGLRTHQRHLDMRSGQLVRTFTWETRSGVIVKVETRRMVSMVRRQVALLSYRVEVSDACKIVLDSSTQASPHSKHLNGKGLDAEIVKQGKEECIFKQSSVSSGQILATGIRQTLVTAAEYSSNCDSEATEVRMRYELAAENAETIHFEKIVVFCLQQEGDDSIAEVQSILANLPAITILFQEQAQWWQNYWGKAGIEIEGDTLDQLGVRLSLFHNRQSNPEDGRHSVGANGLTGDNYAGHVFWDTEQYIAVPFLYIEPESVRGLLEYRYRILDKARERARLMQSKGAEYSWNSITGEECGHVFEAAQGQIHLQSDIAWAIDRYVSACDDQDFMHQMGAEIIFETARYLFDRGAFSDYRDGQFVFNAVCGSNEYACGVDNNAYTNYMAQWHFSRAVEIAAEIEKVNPELWNELSSRLQLEKYEIGNWQHASERMYLPYDKKLGIVPQDDNFLSRDPVDMSRIPFHFDMRSVLHPLNLWRMQLIKQADAVLLMFMMNEKFDKQTIEKTYQFHEARTNHGSSLSACIHAIVACDVGKVEDDYHFFRESALMDINDLKSNTSGGVHSACMGGTWMAVVNGFAGMRDDSRGLSFHPRLPEAWTRLCFQMVWRGVRLEVEMKRNAVIYRHISGPSIQFRHRQVGVDLAVNTEKEFTQ